MKSLLHLVLICALITGSTAVAFDVFAASGEGILLPLNVRLQYTSGSVCNGFVWTFEAPGRFLRQLASVNDECNKQECNNKTRPHCSLTSNGSLQLYGVRPEDAGLYTISTYHITRAKSTEDTFNLRVLDAVSQPVVTLECPSDGQPEVSCRAANGTNISTSIIVNGDLSGSEGNFSLFKVSSSAPWNIICSVTNKISHKTISVLYTMCPEPLSEPRLEILCRLDGSVEISCKTENGSDPSFSWFVDENPVQSTSSWDVTGNLLSGSGRIAVNVSCSARNTINSVRSAVTSVSCPAGAPHLTVRVFCKILLFALYNVLLISMVRTIISNDRGGSS